MCNRQGTPAACLLFYLIGAQVQEETRGFFFLNKNTRLLRCMTGDLFPGFTRVIRPAGGDILVFGDTGKAQTPCNHHIEPILHADLVNICTLI